MYGNSHVYTMCNSKVGMIGIFISFTFYRFLFLEPTNF